MAGQQQDPLEAASEADLLLRIAGGDRAAFAALFRRVGPRIKGYLMRSGSSATAAEELTQEVMLTIWRKAALYDPNKAGALTWIFVVARNGRIDSLRRERSSVTYGIEPPETPDENTPSAADQLAGAERDKRVRAAMDHLTPDQKEVIRRSFFEEEPHSAIAAALNLPLGTVKSRLRLAMSRLRAHLEDVR